MGPEAVPVEGLGPAEAAFARLYPLPAALWTPQRTHRPTRIPKKKAARMSATLWLLANQNHC